MGKRIIARARGKGPRYRVLSHKYVGKVEYILDRAFSTGLVVDIIHDPGRQ